MPACLETATVALEPARLPAGRPTCISGGESTVPSSICEGLTPSPAQQPRATSGAAGSSRRSRAGATTHQGDPGIRRGHGAARAGRSRRPEAQDRGPAPYTEAFLAASTDRLPPAWGRGRAAQGGAVRAGCCCQHTWKQLTWKSASKLGPFVGRAHTRAGLWPQG